MSFIEQLDPVGDSPTEHQLNFLLGERSQGRIASFCGNLIGPHCEYARTLPATFSVPPCECLPGISNRTQRIITDPCYWTPQLPYLYNFEGKIKLADGTVQSWSHTVGFRRWEVEGKNLRLERRRIVLRGAVADAESAVDLRAAHDAEVALLVKEPSDSFLQQASECGVMVIADFRGVETELTPRLLRLAWQPSVAFVLLSDTDKPGFYKPPAVTIGHAVDAKAQSVPESTADEWASLLLVELGADERPPEWLANTEKPVIAIRRDESYANMTDARTACDRLQSDLAPQLNLAGYFVSP
ncbi:MAG: hypothetical protein GXP28_01615 [Planctomycetes bacterium]|nr:hypothetical protein [Planctomycetota bacterium]